MKKIYGLLLILLNVGCAERSVSVNTPSHYEVAMTELTDAQYPDDPDIPLRSKNYGTYSFKDIQINWIDSVTFSMVLLPANAQTDSIVFPSLKLREWIPTVPSSIRSNAYLSFISLVNLEWNRQQVRFRKEAGGFKVKGDSKEVFVRIDIARNCLNTGLWEIIAYAKEQGKEKPLYHGWFDFPMDLFATLFNQQNTIDFEEYKGFLVEWKDPESKEIPLGEIREVLTEKPVNFLSKNKEMYVLKGERKKKFKNIIFPKNPRCINDFLTDSTQFATFTPPGFYNTKAPRVTELGRFKKLVQVVQRRVKGLSGDTLVEFELSFQRINGTATQLFIGDIALEDIPVLPDSMAHKGFQMPMGIGNHSFYESYEYAIHHSSIENPYYAFFLDAQGKWLDSHRLGVDGPLFYKDIQGNIHLQLLSFERHAVVGHYVFKTAIES